MFFYQTPWMTIANPASTLKSPLMVAGNAGVKYTIPSCLKAGYYLVRHEIIALHSAYAYPGAQFYPGCHQLKVTGGGSTTPSNLVAFPGAYKGSDAGITYDAYKGELEQADTRLLEKPSRLTARSPNLHCPRPSCIHLLVGLLDA